MAEKRYIQVILPLRLEWEPCYCLDGADSSAQVRTGDRVRVLFSGRSYVGVVSAVDVQPDIEPARISAVRELLPELPAVSPEEMQFWRFIADYYLCTIGEVYKAAAVGKPQSQVKKPRLKLPGNLARPVVDSELNAVETLLSKDKPVLYRAQNRTEDYLALLTNCVASGLGALVLVPERATAAGLQKQLSERFGPAVLEYWSDITPARRRLTADRVRAGGPYVLLGTRSALLLPFRQLGLVIVDGEQSPFYKSDTAPRYNTRDAAVVLGRVHGAPVLLGSSAPSLESEYNVAAGRYSSAGSISETQGFELINTAAELRKNGMLGCISRKLAAQCADGRVALIRGFEKEELVLADVASAFPGQEERFAVFTAQEACRTDLAAFDLVAMLSADALFRIEDFRSDERAWQLLDALRQGSKRLIVQMRNPGHQVFQLNAGNAAEALLAERRHFSLPPYTRLVDILIPGGEKTRLFSEGLSRRLSRSGFAASDAQIHADGRNLIRITLQRNRSLESKKRALREAVAAYCAERNFRAGVVLDVDPA